MAKQKEGAKAAPSKAEEFSFNDANEFSAELLAAVRFKMKDKFLATLALRPEVANILDNEGNFYHAKVFSVVNMNFTQGMRWAFATNVERLHPQYMCLVWVQSVSAEL